MEEVADDDVVRFPAVGDEASGVLAMEAELACRGPGGTISDKKRGGLSDAGEEFHGICEEIGKVACGVGGDSSAEAEEEDVVRGRVEEEGDIGLALLGDGDGGAAHLESVIDAEGLLSGGVFGDGNAGIEPFPCPDRVFTWRPWELEDSGWKNGGKDETDEGESESDSCPWAFGEWSWQGAERGGGGKDGEDSEGESGAADGMEECGEDWAGDGAAEEVGGGE